MNTENTVVKQQMEHEKRLVEINHLMAQTVLANKRIRWYEVTLLGAAIVSIITLTKLFSMRVLSWV